jgi:hypothetical protein
LPVSVRQAYVQISSTVAPPPPPPPLVSVRVAADQTAAATSATNVPKLLSVRTLSLHTIPGNAVSPAPAAPTVVIRPLTALKMPEDLASVYSNSRGLIGTLAKITLGAALS